MNSVERVKEYIDIERERSISKDDEADLPADWPKNGSVEFRNYTTRYRANLEPALKLNLTIKAGEKIGVVGRTGAGKSSLALSILRVLESDEGSILIDGIDISKISLEHLRESIAFVPQNPTAFSGTLRSNLDPFHQRSDAEIFAALRAAHLIPSDRIAGSSSTASSVEYADDSEERIEAPTEESFDTTTTVTNVFLDLSTPIADSGTNLSLGQRQLICVARALLKSPHLIIMDEATASIDYATDAKIQSSIRDQHATTITIAHRLKTIADYDRVLVLDHGVAVEYDHPHQLLQVEGGIFRGMCESSADFEQLEKIAEASWKEKNRS